MSSFANVILGNVANGGGGDSLRVAFSKINQNFANIQNGSANITVSAPVRTVAGRVGSIVLSVNDVAGAASIGYVNTLVTAANVYANLNYSSFATTVYNNISANLASNISSQASSLINSSNALAPLTGFQANLTAANVNIQNLQANLGTVVVSTIPNILSKQNTFDANLGTVTTNITTLFSNAAGQATSINTLTANAAVQKLSADYANTAISTVSVAVTSLQSNAANQESQLVYLLATTSNLWGNAGVQSSDIGNLVTAMSRVNANVTAANASIVNTSSLAQLQTNVNTINNSISATNANIASANVQITTLWANAAGQAIDLSTMFANAASQAATLIQLSNLISWATANTNSNISNIQVQVGGALGDVSTLYSNQTSLQSNINLANLNMKSYVDGRIVASQYTNSNVAAYLPTSNLALAINSSITTSNVSMKYYVDTSIASVTQTTASQANLISALNANVTAANAAITALNLGTGFVTYSDLNSNIAIVRTIVTSNVAAANAAAVTANTNMKAYVDGRIYSNSNVATYLPTDPTVIAINANVTAANAAITIIRGNITALNAALSSVTTGTYGNANVAVYLPSYAGNVTAGNVISNNHLFANGVNILSTIGAGTYSNTNVAAYLIANPPTGTYSNTNVASYLVANPPTGTYSNTNVASYLVANPINVLRNGSGTSNVTIANPNDVITFGVYNAATGTAANSFTVCSGIVHVNTTLRVFNTSQFDGNITVLGNVISNNYLFANGVSILSGVVSKTTSSWTVATGTGTYSFTVPASGTYQLWVDCNIPNGILAYNATATVTNTNVPVVGAQYAWVYNGGGTPIDFTSIPNQFVGTGNTIVRSNTAPSATTNRFDFGINNTSGNVQIVRYGWARIS
jgi:hypothetical protein